jgi:hypothetical protein
VSPLADTQKHTHTLLHPHTHTLVYESHSLTHTVLPPHTHTHPHTSHSHSHTHSTQTHSRAQTPLDLFDTHTRTITVAHINFPSFTQALARELSAMSTVLLQNEGGLLPLNSKPSKPFTIALIGPDAHDGCYTGGGGSGAVPTNATVSCWWCWCCACAGSSADTGGGGEAGAFVVVLAAVMCTAPTFAFLSACVPAPLVHLPLLRPCRRSGRSARSAPFWTWRHSLVAWCVRMW